MNKDLSLNRTQWARIWKFSGLWIFLVLAVMVTSGESLAAVSSPLQESGLTALWEENFTNASIQRLQYGWFKGNFDALASYVQPDAVFLGRDGGTTADDVEQQINKFKESPGELLASTVEFDVYSPQNGRGRVSLRPNRRGDMTTFLLGMNNDRTEVSFGKDNFRIVLDEKTGPTLGWAHVVLSYRQFDQGGVLMADFTIAVNNEVHTYQQPSEVTAPTFSESWDASPNAVGWSIEHNSNIVTLGRYIANIRGYSEFLSGADLTTRLAGRVEPYRTGLPDPTAYAGPKKAFKDSRPFLTDPEQTPLPYAKAYAAPVSGNDFAFDGSLSSYLHKITSYEWNFGDGQTGSGRFPNHTYAAGGTYDVALTITSEGLTDAHTIQVTVGGPPPPTTPPPTEPPVGDNFLYLPFIVR